MQGREGIRDNASWVAAMNFKGFIRKTIDNKRGYTYGHYYTEYAEGRIRLFHYRTSILEIDTIANRILNYMEYEAATHSDKRAISRALSEFEWMHDTHYNRYIQMDNNSRMVLPDGRYGDLHDLICKGKFKGYLITQDYDANNNKYYIFATGAYGTYFKFIELDEGTSLLMLNGRRSNKILTDWVRIVEMPDWLQAYLVAKEI